ncbi:unnamed protein product [Mytilus edulis]|uniref:Uncharacterized protein n=1 Tax=Mytilus edulis TaxID=6550 RepID=A0A8S3U595_MYTED|nr:unnamed protein product [Mytilus edulis]
MAENEELDVHDREVSLSDVMQAVKTQGEFNASLRKDISDLRQEVHGATVSVASQVKKLKTESQYNWKYEGNKVQFLLNTEFLEDLTQSIWAIDNSKVDYARDTIKNEGGWETVRQYETNPVASDSDDESKINKAENKALRKRNSNLTLIMNRVLLLNLMLLFQQKISPFVTPSHGTTGKPCTMVKPVKPARVVISEEINNAKELVMDVDRSSIGETNVLSTQDLAPCRNQNKTDFIKDEYSLNILPDNTTSVVSNIESDNLTTDYYEYEQGQANIIVKDRLKNHYLFWKSIGCYEFILDTILNGYKIPFYSTPQSICLQNNRSAIIHSEFVTEAIHDLLIRGLIEECDIQPRIVNPLTVSSSNSKKETSHFRSQTC